MTRKAFLVLLGLSCLAAAPSGRTAGAPPQPAAETKGDRRFTVPEGFVVDTAAKNPDPKDPFSLVNICFDAKGRLLVSQEDGPVLLCTDPDKDGVLQNVRPYCELVKNCQGMCWVKDALLLVGDGPDGAGLYRCRDAKGADKIDEAKRLLLFPKVKVPGHGEYGGMGEHGPHAILHGPDGSLYLVVGNHAWAKPDKLAENSPLKRWPDGQMGPDQFKPGSTEDVLLPRLNDPDGHGADILAPGGTVWRLDPDGKNVALVAAGLRNAFDATLRTDGELFTFDSDAERDEGLPWRRPVRVCHCPPGADFVWRSGSANTPDYYIDGLPAAYGVGRGSPVGMDFYEHTAFPEKYQGAYFLGDRSLGVIYAARLKRAGSTFAAELEKFCTGAPMNVTDLAVAPDGSLYFTTGGRHTEGGVYRVRYTGAKKTADAADLDTLLSWPQPLAAWSRADLAKWSGDHKGVLSKTLSRAAADAARPAAARIKCLTLMEVQGQPAGGDLLAALLADKDAEVRAQAVYLVGVHDDRDNLPGLLRLLKDDDGLVRRRACEALIRMNVQPRPDEIWPLLRDRERFVRTAARLVVQRIDPKLWAKQLGKEESDDAFFEGAVALCKTDQAGPYAEAIFERLHRGTPEDPDLLLDYLRTLELTLLHSEARPGSVRGIALECEELFPHKDDRVSRELAALLTYFRRSGVLDEDVHARLLTALLDAKGDRQQQIHYFSCLRLLRGAWTAEQKKDLRAWYDGTKDWKGGESFKPYLEDIYRKIMDD
jgi:hypothetical protein